MALLLFQNYCQSAAISFSERNRKTNTSFYIQWNTQLYALLPGFIENSINQGEFNHKSAA